MIGRLQGNCLEFGEFRRRGVEANAVFLAELKVEFRLKLPGTLAFQVNLLWARTLKREEPFELISLQIVLASQGLFCGCFQCEVC